MKRRPVASVNVLEALRRRYCAPAYAFIEQVGTATGFSNRGYCDALAVSLWPSRGLHLHGFEVKVSRSDWIRERDNPEKAERFFERCHFWYVAAPAGVVEISELPPEWGLLEVGGRMTTRREAKLREVPAPDWGFLAAILRRAAEAEAGRGGEIERRVEIRAEAIAEERIASGGDRRTKERLEEFARLQQSVKDFEQASGLRVAGYGGGKKLGESVEKLQRLESLLAGYRSQAKQTADISRRAAEALIAMLDERAPDVVADPGAIPPVIEAE